MKISSFADSPICETLLTLSVMARLSSCLQSLRVFLLLSPTTACFPTDPLPNGHVVRRGATSMLFQQMTRMLFPMHVLSPTTTNPHLLFPFLLDVCALSALVFIIDSQLPKQPSRCRSCQRRERCSHCHLLKKIKHFRNPTHHDRYYFPLLTSLPATLSLSTNCFNGRGRN